MKNKPCVCFFYLSDVHFCRETDLGWFTNTVRDVRQWKYVKLKYIRFADQRGYRCKRRKQVCSHLSFRKNFDTIFFLIFPIFLYECRLLVTCDEDSICYKKEARKTHSNDAILYEWFERLRRLHLSDGILRMNAQFYQSASDYISSISAITLTANAIKIIVPMVWFEFDRE